MKNSKTSSKTESTTDKSRGSLDYIISMATVFPDVPALIRDELPDGKYVKLTDFKSLLKKIADQLTNLSKRSGIVVLERSQVADLVVSLAQVADNSQLDLPGPDFALEALRELNEKEMRRAVEEAKAIVNKCASAKFSFEEITQYIEQTHNPGATRLALKTVGPKAPIIQTSNGPLDLSTEKQLPRELQSDAKLDVVFKIVGGLNDFTGMFECRVINSSQTEYSLVRAGSQYWVRMVEHEHRTAILCAQLLQSELKAKVQVDRVPLDVNSRNDLKLLLLEVEPSVETSSMVIRLIGEQMNLDLNDKFLP
jgi:hypothetical protein